MEIDREQFERCTDYLVTHAERLGDGWQKCVNPGRSEVYAVKECLVATNQRKEPERDESLSDAELSDDGDESSLAASTCGLAQPSVTRRYVYHVLYSLSYRVPVLYFNAYTLDGKLVSLDDVWNAVPEHFQDRLKEERWTFLTQQEHPLLGRPYFQLHPCKTASLMESLQCASTSDHYVCSWLSAVGPVVGISMSAAYFIEPNP